MKLENTKQVLSRLHGRFNKDLAAAKVDIKPSDHMGAALSGYPYTDIATADKIFIYQSICALHASFNSADSPILLDIENHFITETKAVEALKTFYGEINDRLSKLNLLSEKYGKDGSMPYPLQVCLDYYIPIVAVIYEIVYSEEIKLFESPDRVSSLERKIENLEFEDFWRTKRKWYRVHLGFFLVFLVVCSFLIYHRDKKDLMGIGSWIVTIASGLYTIFFSVFFNNYNSFKDSFKLFSKKRAIALKSKLRSEFNKRTLT
jgi:hypothetical protein